MRKEPSNQYVGPRFGSALSRTPTQRFANRTGTRTGTGNWLSEVQTNRRSWHDLFERPGINKLHRRSGIIEAMEEAGAGEAVQKYSDDDDPFMPVYEAQLWGYARLLESNGIGPVSGAALVYFENCLANYKDSPLDLLSDDGMRVPFTVKLHPVEIDLKALDGLLKKFRKYADMTGPLVDCDCKTCDRLQRLFAIDKKFRSRCREAVVRDMAFQDRLVVERVLSGQESRWRETLVAESHAWEADLNDLLASDSDCVPGPLDL